MSYGWTRDYPPTPTTPPHRCGMSDTEQRRTWWTRFLAPWRDTPLILTAVTHTIPNRLEAYMADTSPILNKLADDMAAWSAGPFAELLARNTALEAENASLRGEDAAESDAADRAVAEWNRIVRPVTDSPDVPTDLPEVTVPDAPVDATPPVAPDSEQSPNA